MVGSLQELRVKLRGVIKKGYKASKVSRIHGCGKYDSPIVQKGVFGSIIRISFIV